MFSSSSPISFASTFAQHRWRAADRKHSWHAKNPRAQRKVYILITNLIMQPRTKNHLNRARPHNNSSLPSPSFISIISVCFRASMHSFPPCMRQLFCAFQTRIYTLNARDASGALASAENHEHFYFRERGRTRWTNRKSILFFN